MTSLTEFLLARIAEDEEAARTAADSESGERYESRPVGLRWIAKRGLVHGEADPDVKLWDNEGAESLEMSPAVADHIARHDPARVLAECDAKRGIVGERTSWEPGEGDYYQGKDRAWEQACQYLALPYADHPDYDETWRL